MNDQNDEYDYADDYDDSRPKDLSLTRNYRTDPHFESQPTDEFGKIEYFDLADGVEIVTETPHWATDQNTFLLLFDFGILDENRVF